MASPIKKEQIGSAFEALIRDLTPPKPLFDAAAAMFKELWEERSHHRHREIFTIKKEKGNVERRINTLLERIIEADDQSMIATYEGKDQGTGRRKGRYG